MNELPNGWEKQKFADIIEFLTDFQANGSFAGLKDNVQYYSERNYAVLVRLKDLRHDLKDEGSFVYTDEKGYNFLKKSRVVEGDLLVANVGAGVGTIIKMPKFAGKATLGPNMFRVDLKKIISDKFFFAFSISLDYWQQLKLVIAGSGQPKINKSQYRSIEIPLPSLEVQQAIVSKIEELFSELDKGIENLRLAQHQLKTYRQSVLNTLVTGKNCQTIESVIEKLDQGWSPKCENEASTDKTQWAVIKTSAVQHGYFLEFENKILPKNLKPREQHELFEGDILITRAGPRVRVGVCCMIKHTRPRLINCDKVYRIKVNDQQITPEYFEFILNTPQYQDEIEKMKSGISDSGLNLTQKAFLQISIPVPSINDQKESVLEIENHLSVADKMEESIRQSLQQAEALRQSILKKAFEGKLL